jgi:hypothetical protein
MTFGVKKLCAAVLVWGLSLGGAHAGTTMISTAIDFGDATVSLNGATSLVHTITANGNIAPLDFSTNLGPDLEVASPNGLTNTCAGTVTALSGSNTVSLTGGSTVNVVSVGPPIVFGCVLSVNVRGVSVGSHTATATFPGGPGFTPRTATLQVVAAIASAASIPTLSEWGLILLVLAMAVSAFKAVRRQR